MAMVSDCDGRLLAREGALGMQQKMLRQRQLVLKRQTDAAKSFGVVAQQHAPTSETPRQAPSWPTAAPEAPLAPRGKDPVGIAPPPSSAVGIAQHHPPGTEMHPEVTPESLEDRSMTLELDALDALGIAGIADAQAEKPETVGQGWDLDVASAPKGPKTTRFWTPWRAEAKPEECAVQAVVLDRLTSPEPESKHGSTPGADGYGEGASALNMGRVATPWIGAGQDLGPLPGELNPEDMVEPVLEETGEGFVAM